MDPEARTTVAGVDAEHPLGRAGRAEGVLAVRIAFFGTLGVDAYAILTPSSWRGRCWYWSSSRCSSPSG